MLPTPGCQSTGEVIAILFPKSSVHNSFLMLFLSSKTIAKLGGLLNVLLLAWS